MENYSDTNPAQESTTTDSAPTASTEGQVQTTPTAEATPSVETPTTSQPTSSSEDSSPQPTKEVSFVPTKENNKQVKAGNKTVAKDNVVSVTKKTLKTKQTELTEKMLAKAQAMGVGLKITRGRLSNMCNGNCNVTAQAEQVCKALLADAGYTATEKVEEPQAPTATPTAVA